MLYLSNAGLPTRCETGRLKNRKRILLHLIHGAERRQSRLGSPHLPGSHSVLQLKPARYLGKDRCRAVEKARKLLERDWSTRPDVEVPVESKCAPEPNSICQCRRR
jgi:hypothetical protein